MQPISLIIYISLLADEMAAGSILAIDDADDVVFVLEKMKSGKILRFTEIS